LLCVKSNSRRYFSKTAHQFSYDTQTVFPRSSYCSYGTVRASNCGKNTQQKERVTMMYLQEKTYLKHFLVLLLMVAASATFAACMPAQDDAVDTQQDVQPGIMLEDDPDAIDDPRPDLNDGTPIQDEFGATVTPTPATTPGATVQPGATASPMVR
jgi:hypothetical protein